jgi:hypothetical protein
LHYEAGLNEALGNPSDERLESTTRRIANAGENLLQGIFLSDEAAIVEPIKGEPEFVETFVSHGPHDRQGRSLRELDLGRRLFKYPCSFLIYSEAFDALPEEMARYLRKRIPEILEGRGGEHFGHLSRVDRQAISEILRDTKPKLWSHGE